MLKPKSNLPVLLLCLVLCCPLFASASTASKYICPTHSPSMSKTFERENGCPQCEAEFKASNNGQQKSDETLEAWHSRFLKAYNDYWLVAIMPVSKDSIPVVNPWKKEKKDSKTDFISAGAIYQESPSFQQINGALHFNGVTLSEGNYYGLNGQLFYLSSKPKSIHQVDDALATTQQDQLTENSAGQNGLEASDKSPASSLLKPSVITVSEPTVISGRIPTSQLNNAPITKEYKAPIIADRPLAETSPDVPPPNPSVD